LVLVPLRRRGCQGTSEVSFFSLHLSSHPFLLSLSRNAAPPVEKVWRRTGKLTSFLLLRTHWISRFSVSFLSSLFFMFPLSRSSRTFFLIRKWPKFFSGTDYLPLYRPSLGDCGKGSFPPILLLSRRSSSFLREPDNPPPTLLASLPQPPGIMAFIEDVFIAHGKSFLLSELAPFSRLSSSLLTLLFF